MHSVYVTLTTFAIVCGGAVIGFALQKFLQERHLSAQTQDSVKLATGIVGTLTALVLGLLVASAKQSFDAQAGAARTFVINITLLDRSMRLYQPPLTAERQQLADFATAMRTQLWDASGVPNIDVLSRLDRIRTVFRNLDPQNLQDKSLKDRYIKLSDTLILTANELLETDESPIPASLIGIVDAWLALIFIGFGLFAPLNRISVPALVVGAAAVAMALFVIIEMSSPFQGFITVSPNLMDRAIAQLSRT
jgi:hypothetical protein